MHAKPAETSTDAHRAHRGNGRARVQCERILEHIRDCGGDWSIGEIARALEMEKSTVSARVNELLNETEELAACPKRNDRVSGVLVRPVALPAKQMAALAAAPRGMFS